jgi:hypothetical protein
MSYPSPCPSLTTHLQHGDSVIYTPTEREATLIAIHEDGTATIEFAPGARIIVKRPTIRYSPSEDVIGERAFEIKNWNLMNLRNAT